MEEFETANHSGNEEVYEQGIPTESIETPAEGNDSPPQEEPRGIKVKYNKEERFVPEDEVPNWVQKGLNYDKVSEKAQQAERYQQNLDRIAKFYGYESHEDYMTALEQEEQNRILQETAMRYGVDEEFLRSEFNPIKKELDQTKSELQQLREAESLRQVENQIASMERDTDKFPDFGKYKNDVINIAATRGYTLEDAYKIATYEERVTNARLQAQQEAVRNLQINADSATGSLGADSPEHQGGYAGMSAADRRAFREAVKAGKQPTF